MAARRGARILTGRDRGEGGEEKHSKLYSGLIFPYSDGLVCVRRILGVLILAHKLLQSLKFFSILSKTGNLSQD